MVCFINMLCDISFVILSLRIYFKGIFNQCKDFMFRTVNTFTIYICKMKNIH